MGEEAVPNILGQSLVHTGKVKGVGGGRLGGSLRGQGVKGRSNLF